MPGLGIGLGLGLGWGGGALNEAAVAAALATRGLTDAQARAAIGGAASLPAGLRGLGLLPALPVARPSMSAVTPLPDGIVAMWDAASLAALADGAAVTRWTDGTGGIVAGQTGDSGASHSFVRDSGGGLPAVRLSGAAVLATAGDNAADTAMSSGECSIVVVARNVRDGQGNPCLAASGTGTGCLLQANTAATGLYGAMFACADAGIRTVGVSVSAARSYNMVGVNGTAIAGYGGGGGQVYIGGWQNAGTLCCGRADVLAVIVFGRAVTAADFKAVRRRYCQLAGEAYPAARPVSFIGNSLTAGYPVGFDGSYPRQMAQALGLAWGTWDQLGVSGFTWFDMRDRTLPALGDVSGATGARSIVCAFEFENMRTQDLATITGAARGVIDALHAQDAAREVILGSSVDDGSQVGVATRQTRAGYNAYWDTAANRAGVAAYVPLHLDPSIGVEGAAPTDGTANAWFQADDEHLTAAGYALIDAGPHGFRAAVQTRLAS